MQSFIAPSFEIPEISPFNQNPRSSSQPNQPPFETSPTISSISIASSLFDGSYDGKVTESSLGLMQTRDYAQPRDVGEGQNNRAGQNSHMFNGLEAESVVCDFIVPINTNHAELSLHQGSVPNQEASCGPWVNQLFQNQSHVSGAQFTSPSYAGSLDEDAKSVNSTYEPLRLSDNSVQQSHNVTPSLASEDHSLVYSFSTSSSQDTDRNFPQSTYHSQFPHDIRLFQVAVDIWHSSWLRNHEPEPPLQPGDTAIIWGMARQGCSRFDCFYEKGKVKRCLWVENGTQCSHTAERPGRAREHAYKHFDYRPIPCRGKCTLLKCMKRFVSPSQLKDHVKRVKQPKQRCEHCGGEFTVQNCQRHKKKCMKKLKTSSFTNLATPGMFDTALFLQAGALHCLPQNY